MGGEKIPRGCDGRLRKVAGRALVLDGELCARLPPALMLMLLTLSPCPFVGTDLDEPFSIVIVLETRNDQWDDCYPSNSRTMPS